MNNLIPIKKTKSVEMLGNRQEVIIRVLTEGNWEHGQMEAMIVPMSKAFQVKRGLVSYIQKFYRKR